MIIKRIPLEKLNPAVYNPRKDLRPGDPEYQKLKNSIETFGCVQTIVWNERTGNVVGGHQTLKVLRDLGLTEADVSVVDLDESHEKALNIALNKISGEWDDEKLNTLLTELEADADFDMALIGFDPDEIDRLCNGMTADDSTDNISNGSKELDPDEYKDDKFDCMCPRCGFRFNKP